MLKRSAFTIDVEDGVSIAMRDVFGKVSPQTDRVITNTRKILDLLEQHQTLATFFILGEVARDFPGLVKQIAAGGHEIGVHGYHHLRFFNMTPQKATEELTSAKKLLEDLLGIRVEGHRAPAFSVSPKTAWALDVIAECGFIYDSSIMPIKSGLYGWPDFPSHVTIVRTLSGKELTEVPINTLQIGKRQLPYSGGSYLRLLPVGFLKWAFGSKSRNEEANILYLHPYELDIERYPEYYFEALSRKPLLTQLKMRSMWVNRRSVLGKLEMLLQAYPFTSMANFLAEEKRTGGLPCTEVNVTTGEHHVQ
jgi:polysaccharide deacetylase family protein (PEP-CTERM system associated)